MPSTAIDTVVSSNFTNSGAGRILSADLDDYQVTTGACPTVEVDALIQSTGDVRCAGGSPFFFDTINDAIPWTVVGGAQIVVNDTAGVT